MPPTATQRRFRRLLDFAGRSFMWQIIDHFGTKVPDRRASEPMIRAIIRDPEVDLGEALSWLKLPQLRQISEMFHLDVRGREREGFIEAIAEHVRADSSLESDEEEDESESDEREEPAPSSDAPKPRPSARARERGRSAASPPVARARATPVGDDDDEKFDIFIVHGHDDLMRAEIKRFLSDLELTCVVLAEAPDKGLTIIEKLEHYASQARHSIVLLSPDDEGYSKRDGAAKQKARARQNVILELGWMIGKFGRARVTVVHQGGVELPSDIQGLIYIEYDAQHKDAALLRLAKQLKSARFTIDLNRVV